MAKLDKTAPVTLQELLVSSFAQTDALAKLLIEKGLITQESFGGVSGAQALGYIHKIRMQVAGDSYETTVCFCYELSMAGILGQTGFFDHFIATFDWTPNPPTFELERIEPV